MRRSDRSNHPIFPRREFEKPYLQVEVEARTYGQDVRLDLKQLHDLPEAQVWRGGLGQH